MEGKNFIKKINPVSCPLQWFSGNHVVNFLQISILDFKSDVKTKYVRTLSMKGYILENHVFSYAVELVDKKSNKYFLLLRYNKIQENQIQQEILKDIHSSDLTKETQVLIPIFDIEFDNSFFHVGEDGIKMKKKNVYQDIASYLDLNIHENLEQVQADQNSQNETDDNSKKPFTFALIHKNLSRNINKNSSLILYGYCFDPVIHLIKESIVRQFQRSPCFEKLIFSCRQEKKTYFQLFSKFFVIIDRNFLFDTFNYWHDKTTGIEADYIALVKKNGISFSAAKQHLIDANADVEGFINSALDDQDQANYKSLRSYLSLRTFSFNTDQEKIIFSVFCLYGLLHAKYILTPPGQAKMLELYIYNSFPKCPRSKCDGIRCFPYGITEVPCCQSVKLYCPKCKTIYNYETITLDGAFFGPTYIHLMIRKFPELKKFDDESLNQDKKNDDNKFSMFGIPLITKEELQKLNDT